MPLLILLAQQMQIIAASHGSSQLKFIADLFDKCQQTLYQVCTWPASHGPESCVHACMPETSQHATSRQCIL